MHITRNMFKSTCKQEHLHIRADTLKSRMHLGAMLAMTLRIKANGSIVCLLFSSKCRCISKGAVSVQLLHPQCTGRLTAIRRVARRSRRRSELAIAASLIACRK